MSSVTAVHPVQTYASVLQAATQTYNESKPLLAVATEDSKVKGSILNLIEDCYEQVKILKSTPVKSETYEQIKGKFIHFTKNLLPLYTAIQSVKELGLKAIETVSRALATATANKKTADELSAMKKHLTWLSLPTEDFDRIVQESAITETLGEQVKTLTSLTNQVGKLTKGLDSALNTTFYHLKKVEGKTGKTDLIPSFRNFYLAQALAEYKEVHKTLDTYLPKASSSSSGTVEVLEGTAVVQKRKVSFTSLGDDAASATLMDPSNTPPLHEIPIGANM